MTLSHCCGRILSPSCFPSLFICLALSLLCFYLFVLGCVVHVTIVDIIDNIEILIDRHVINQGRGQLRGRPPKYDEFINRVEIAMK